MAVSGSSDFNSTRDEICYDALVTLGVIKGGETPSAQVITDTARRLNAMVKRWQKKQIHVWTKAEATLFPQASQVRYALVAGSTDHATETFYQTEISTGGEASGQTVLSVEDTTNITASDYAGIVVDDGTVHWSTVSSKTSTTITIADALDDDASAGNAVFTYTTKIVRPLKIVDARRYDITSGIETPLAPMLARMDYQALPNKTQTGTINQAWYDPGNTTGYLHIWNPMAAVTDLLKFTWCRPIMDFDAAGDSPDLPQEWLDALVFNLAVSIAPMFDVPLERVTMVATMAQQYLDDVAGDDREDESLYVGVDMGP
jgi:hypothetical protein